MKITTQTIANLAGVSRATVDKVIHNRQGVSPAMREKIKNLMLENNYQPLKLRKQLTNNTTQIKIAVIMPDIQDNFMTNLKAGMDFSFREYQPYGLQLDYYFCNSYDPQPLIAILQYLQKTDIDGIALRGIKDDTVISIINELVANNVTVFTFDADLNESNRICFIGEDLFLTGRIGASLLCKSIGYKGDIALLVGGMNVDSSFHRVQGFRSYIEEYAPNVNIVAIEETLCQQAITYKKTLNLLEKYPDLKGIWNAVAYSEFMAKAVIDANKQKQIKLGALSISPNVLQLIKEQIIDHSIALFPYKMGKTVIKSLYKYLLSDETVPKENIEIPSSIIIDANIDTFIEKNLKLF